MSNNLKQKTRGQCDQIVRVMKFLVAKFCYKMYPEYLVTHWAILKFFMFKYKLFLATFGKVGLLFMPIPGDAALGPVTWALFILEHWRT